MALLPVHVDPNLKVVLGVSLILCGRNQFPVNIDFDLACRHTMNQIKSEPLVINVTGHNSGTVNLQRPIKNSQLQRGSMVVISTKNLSHGYSSCATRNVKICLQLVVA